MKDSAANDLINNIIKDVQDKGFNNETIAVQLKELRVFAQKEEDPLTTKVLRLAAQHLEEEVDFEFVVEEEEYEGEDGEVIKPDPIESTTEENIINFISLMINNNNEYNREDLRSYRNQFYEQM